MSLVIPVPRVLQIQCHYCSRFLPASEVIRWGESINMCGYCYEKHTKAVEAFNPPHECAGPCKRTFAQISAETPGPHINMTAHWKDGVYQLLCQRCDAAYVPKRKDLYGATRFGYERGVK